MHDGIYRYLLSIVYERGKGASNCKNYLPTERVRVLILKLPRGSRSHVEAYPTCKVSCLLAEPIERELLSSIGGLRSIAICEDKTLRMVNEDTAQDRMPLSKPTFMNCYGDDGNFFLD